MSTETELQFPTGWFVCPQCKMRLTGKMPSQNLLVNATENEIPIVCCYLCLGILQPEFGLNEFVLKENIEKLVVQSGFEFNSIQIQVNIPLVCQLYDGILAALMYPENDDLTKRNAFLENAHPIKYYWNILVKDILFKIFKKPILRRIEDCTVDSLIFEIDFQTKSHLPTEKQTEFLQDIISEHNGKPRKRRYEKMYQIRNQKETNNGSGHSVGSFRLGREKVASAIYSCQSKKLTVAFEDQHPMHKALNENNLVNLPPLEMVLRGMHRVSNICLGGRYIKLSRRLPHTPWLVDDSRRLEDSVEELIAGPSCHYFNAVKGTFSSSGREDVDVRMLGNGRPFIYELENYHFIPKEPIGEHLIQLEKEINAKAMGRLLIKDLQLVTPESTKTIKVGEESKTKRYQGVCWCSRVITPTAMTLVNQSLSHQPLTIHQWTPVRVLHRRALLQRQRLLYSVIIRPVTQDLGIVDSVSSRLSQYPPEHLFIIDIHCQAGTYVKEFVHGDLGRTLPNVSTILEELIWPDPEGESPPLTCDMLALDVVEVALNWPPTFDVLSPTEVDEAQNL